MRAAAALSILFLVAAVGVTFVECTPEVLPGVALGSDVLLHLERVAALSGIVVAIATVLLRAARGRLPTQVSTTGMSYEAAAAEAARAAVYAASSACASTSPAPAASRRSPTRPPSVSGASGMPLTRSRTQRLPSGRPT